MLWSPQWDGAPVIPPNTDRAGDAHQGQWTESVHLPEAGAGSGLPQQTPRLLQLSLHLLPGASSSRRAQRTQTRKLSQRGEKKVFFSNTLEKWCSCSGGHCLCCLLVEDADAGFLLRAENHSVHSSLILYLCLRVHGDGPWKQHELGGHRRSQVGTRQAFKAFLFVSNVMLQLCATPQIPNSSGPRCLVEAPLLAITAGFALLGRRISRPSLQILCPVGWQQLVHKCPLVTLSCLLLRRSFCLDLRVLEHCSDSLSLLKLFCICIQILWISASDHLLFTFHFFLLSDAYWRMQ